MQDAAAGANGERFDLTARHAAQAVMGHEDAFGLPRGAGGVDEVGQVVAADGDGGWGVALGGDGGGFLFNGDGEAMGGTGMGCWVRRVCWVRRREMPASAIMNPSRSVG